MNEINITILRLFDFILFDNRDKFQGFSTINHNTKTIRKKRGADWKFMQRADFVSILATLDTCNSASHVVN